MSTAGRNRLYHCIYVNSYFESFEGVFKVKITNENVTSTEGSLS